MSISISSDNMMAQNFFSLDSEPSRYIKAKHVAAQSDVSLMASRQNAILSAGMAACASAKSMAELVREGKKAARQVGFDMQQSVSEASERNLKELKRRLEEKAQRTHRDDDGQTKGAPDAPQAEASQAEASSAEASFATSAQSSSTSSESVVPVATPAPVSSTTNTQPVRQNISIMV